MSAKTVYPSPPVAPTDPTGTARRAKLGTLALLWRAILFCVLWVAVYRAAVLMEYTSHASLWFPPAGLSFAAFYIIGWRAFPLVFAGALTAGLWSDLFSQTSEPWSGLIYNGVLFATAHALAYGSGAWVLRRFGHTRSGGSFPRLIVGFLAVGSLTAMLATWLGIVALMLSGAWRAESAADVWLAWWIGDLAGVVVLFPFFCALIERFYPRGLHLANKLPFAAKAGPPGAFVFKLGLCLALLVAALALAALTGRQEAVFAVFFLVIPLMWLVNTETPFRTALSVAVVSTAAVTLIKPFGLFEHALVYQFAITVFAANAFFGLAVPGLVADNRQLRRLANTDSLTQLLSRGSVIEQAGREIRRAERYHYPLCLAVFDLDYLKAINDRLGHPGGDKVLRDLAAVAVQAVRGMDLLGRVGGDEFVAVFPNAELAAAREIVERIRDSLTGCHAGDDGVSASFGLAQHQPGEDYNALFARADQALMQIKRENRGSVGVAAATSTG